jgi:hypothetical protein
MYSRISQVYSTGHSLWHFYPRNTPFPPPGLVIPRLSPAAIPTACGLLGAIIMPHNIYLHSALVNGRKVRVHRPVDGDLLTCKAGSYGAFRQYICGRGRR